MLRHESTIRRWIVRGVLSSGIAWFGLPFAQSAESLLEKLYPDSSVEIASFQSRQPTDEGTTTLTATVRHRTEEPPAETPTTPTPATDHHDTVSSQTLSPAMPILPAFPDSDQLIAAMIQATPIEWRKASQTTLPPPPKVDVERLDLPLPAEAEAEEVALIEEHVARVNHDSARQLVEKLGLDARRARLMVEFREFHGPYERIEDLPQVVGITEAMVLLWEDENLLDLR